MSWPDFCKAISNLPQQQIWRHNQAGDLPGDGKVIDYAALMALARANDGRDGFTYTHYDMTDTENYYAALDAAAHGFTINISTETLEQAKYWYGTWGLRGSLPVTTLLAPDQTGTFWHGDMKVVTCPATYKEDVSCMTCKLCANPNRDHVIGFPVHGSGKGKVIAAIAAERMKI